MTLVKSPAPYAHPLPPIKTLDIQKIQLQRPNNDQKKKN